MTATIDAHHHFWNPAFGYYSWLEPDSALYRPFHPVDLRPLLDAAGIGETILVQAAATETETDWLLDIAAANDWIAGVVGWIDLGAADARSRIRSRAQVPKFVGVRPMLQDLPDREWILREEHADAIAAIAEHGLVFDALVHADQLSAIATRAARHPTLSIVLDHAGKPPLGDTAGFDRWHKAIDHLATFSNVSCKLSGLMTELPPGGDITLVDECIDILIALFGTERLLWGSDWPVALLATSYPRWLTYCGERLSSRSPSERDAVFGGNARRIYSRQPSDPSR